MTMQGGEPPYRTSAREQLRVGLREGRFSLEDLEAVAAEERARIHEATSHAAGSIVREANEDITARLYSLAETEAFLNERGMNLNLQAAREDDVRSMLRWGALNKKDADKYGASLDDPKISGADLQKLLEQFQENPDSEPRMVLGVDTMTPEQAFQKLIVEAGLRQYVYRRFSEYKKVDPKTKEPVKDQRPSGKAGVLFTPDTMNLPAHLRKISPNDQLAKMEKGQKYVGPVGWLKLYRQSIDRALPLLFPEEAAEIDSLSPEAYKKLVLKATLDPRIDEYLPDVKTGTQFPHLRHKDDGAVPNLGFDPYAERREVGLFDYYPVFPYDGLGGRDALGTFLS